MKNNYSPLVLILLLLLFTVPVFAQQGNYNTITFVQNDSSKTITAATDSIVLSKESFSIRYYSRRYNSKDEKYYAMQVAVLKDAADTLVLATGKNIAAVPYFQPGTGMAPGANGLYDAITVDNASHHYLYYENEAERRVSRVSVAKDLLELEWTISGVWQDDQDITLAQLNIPVLYFVFFNDKNLDEIIDAGEIKIVKVKFR